MGLFGETAKQPGVQSASLPMGLLELLIGRGPDTGESSVYARLPVLPFGTSRRLTDGLTFSGQFALQGLNLTPILPEPVVIHRMPTARARQPTGMIGTVLLSPTPDVAPG